MKISYLMISVASKRQSIITLLKASLLIQVSLLLLWGCGSSKYEEFSNSTMGTSYHITANLSGGQNKEAIQKMLTQRLEDIENSMSTYRPNSEINQFNRAELNTPIQVNDDFIKVLKISQVVYQQSNGAFNPSVGALVDLWGFGPKLSIEQFQSVPSFEEIAKAKEQMGFAQIELQGSTISKKIPTQLDFSAVAKGYAVDELAQVLVDHGVVDYMVEIGGEVATKGKSPRGGLWRIGIEAPAEIMGKVVTALELKEDYLATSGDYRNYHDIKGVHYSHTIDPRTGYPVKHKLSSVTVIATSTAEADAWATALMVLGEVEGYQLAEKLAIHSYFIYREGKTFKVKYTTKMSDYFEQSTK